MEEPEQFSSSHTIIDTISLLSQRCVDLLDLVVPAWQASPLKISKPELSERAQALSICGIKKLGDLTTLAPLTLLVLVAQAADSPPDETSFWAHLLHQGREYTALLLKPLLIELLNNFLLYERPPTPKHPPPETGYSSLLIQPQEVIDQVSYPDSITILNWPFAGRRSVAFAEGEIRATPLLAGHVQDALCQYGCDLSAIPLTALALSARTANILERAMERSLESLVRQTPATLFAYRNFGPHAYGEVASALRAYLAPWLAQAPPDMLVPVERSHAFGVETEDEAPAPLATIRYLKVPDPASQEQKPAPRQGKNALFFPIDDVLQALGVLAAERVEEDSPPPLSEDEVRINPLLSKRLIDALAANGCDLMKRHLEDVFRRPEIIRIYNALVRNGIRSIGEIATMTPTELLSLRNLGAVAYRELVQRLQAYLQPWLDQLGLDSATAGDWTAYEDPPLVEELPPLEEAEVALRGADLLGLLEFYAVEWRQILISDVCHDLEFGALPDGLALGEVLEPGQASHPMLAAAPEVADQMIDRIQQALISALVESVFQPALSAQEQLDCQRSLASVSVESLLAEFIKQYIVSQHKGAAEASFDLPRGMQVLLDHAGVIGGQRKTLEELGAMFGLTRARVQQLEARTEESLQRGPMHPFVKGMTLLVKWAIQAAGGVTTVEQAATTIAGWLPFGALDAEAMTRLLVTWARGISSDREGRLYNSSRDSLLYAKIEEQIDSTLHRYPGGLPFDRLVDEVLLTGGEQLFSAGREFISATIRLCDLIEIQEGYCWPGHQGMMRAQLITLLRSLGKPAHFTKIAERYKEQFPDEKPRTAHNVHAFLLRFPSLFVRVGNGTYTFAGQGYETSLTIAEVLEQILQEATRPLHHSEIISLAKERYHWTESALRGGLQTNPKIGPMGNGFFGLAGRTYPDFDRVKTYTELFGIEPLLKDRLVVATYTNQDHHPVVQLKLSAHILTTGALPLTSKPLRELLPRETVFNAEALSPGQPPRKLALKRGRHDLSGLGRWLKSIDAQPGNFLFIEKLATVSEGADYTYRLAYAPHDKVAEAMQVVGLSPAQDEAGGAFDYRTLRQTRDPEKLSSLLAATLAHSWTSSSDVNAALGFAPGSPHGAEYLELGLLGGLLAPGRVEGRASQEIARPTLLGRAWWAREQDADTRARSFLLTLPPYRAHLRTKGEAALLRERALPEQNGGMLLNAELTAAWDDRLGLLSGVESAAALDETGALVATSRLPGPVLTLLCLLLMAQSNGLGIALSIAEASGLVGAAEAAERLRQLGINVSWDAAGRVALNEQVDLAVISSTSVEERLRAQGEPLATALASVWVAVQQRAWPVHPSKASDLYAEAIGASGALFHSLLTPPPEKSDQAARFVDGHLFPCPFLALAADWGLLPAEKAAAPFAFLSHADQHIRDRAVLPVAICLNRELLAQMWDARRALAANAHLALLTIAASDLGGLADRFSLSAQGHFFNGRPLIAQLDALLRGLGYAVWDEAYCQDAQAQGVLGRELVALGERLGLLQQAGAGLEADTPLAREVYYSAYDVLLRAQVLVREGTA